MMNKTNINFVVNKSLVSKEINDNTEIKMTELKTIECPDIDVSSIEEYQVMKTGNYGFIRPCKKKDVRFVNTKYNRRNYRNC